jgi:hypothetical protein
LQVGASSQSIEVTEQTPLLQTQTATMDQVVDSKQVEEIPLNGRNPINLAAPRSRRGLAGWYNGERCTGGRKWHRQLSDRRHG